MLLLLFSSSCNRIKLEGAAADIDNIEFRVRANVMRKELRLLDPETNTFIERIDFGSCYYDCSLTKLAILYNYSPDSIDYVILLEDKGAGIEIV
jgi:hypothetical protein